MGRRCRREELKKIEGWVKDDPTGRNARKRRSKAWEGWMGRYCGSEGLAREEPDSISWLQEETQEEE